MKKYVITTLIILSLIVIFIMQYNKLEEYETNLFYMDTHINIKIYENSATKADEILNEIETIYKDYHILSNRYESFSDIKNINYINNNTGTYEIDNKLYDLLAYGYDWHTLSDGLLNINMGGVIDIWNEAKLNEVLPDDNELKNIDTSITNLVLEGNNTITNKGVNLDLGAIAKGYATQVVKTYLEEENINNYIINAGGNVLAGEKIDSTYKIGIQDPTINNEIFSIVNANNVAVVTSGSYERFYEIDGNVYHHIISPDTLYPSEYIKSVSIVSNDSALSDSLSTILFLMPVDKSLEYIKQFDAEAIFYDINDNIIKTKGYEDYE